MQPMSPPPLVLPPPWLPPPRRQDPPAAATYLPAAIPDANVEAAFNFRILENECNKLLFGFAMGSEAHHVWKSLGDAFKVLQRARLHHRQEGDEPLAALHAMPSLCERARQATDGCPQEIKDLCSCLADQIEACAMAEIELLESDAG